MITFRYESRIVIHLPDRVVEYEWEKIEPEKAYRLARRIRPKEETVEFQVRTIRRTREIIPGFVTGEVT